MKLYYASLISLFFHFIFFLTFSEISSHIEKLKEPEIEVVLVDSKKARIVRNPVTPEPDSKQPSKTDLLSEKNQQFKKQVRAANIGQTVNRSNQKSQEQVQKEFEERLEAVSQISKQVIKKLKKENLQSPSPVDQNPNLFEPSPVPSTVNDPLTNTPLGSFTALNTNRYLYYSYFKRIEDQIRHRWVSKIKSIIDRRPFIKASDQSKEVWPTEIEVLLDKKGHFVRADVHRGSGLSSFDYASIDAFREGAPILNPPQGLIDPDGYIRIRYAFHVYWRPNSYQRYTQ